MICVSYVEKVLQPGEKIVHETTLSWAMYIPGLVLLGVAVLITIVLLILFGTAWWVWLASGVLALSGLVLLAKEWFERWTTEIAITDRRIILKTGFIRRDTIEMSVEKVESIDVNQSLLGRLFDYGDITVRGTGAGFAPLRKIHAPLTFRSHVTGLPSMSTGAAQAED